MQSIETNLQEKTTLTEINTNPFYSATPSWLCKRCICYGKSVRLSVRPPVCPSHSGIVSKRGNTERCGFHYRV